MGLFDWLGDNLGTLGSAALQGYGVYSQNQSADKYYDAVAQAQADKQRLANDQYNYDLMVSQLMGSGGGGGRRGGGGGGSQKHLTPEMFNVYKDYMSKAEAQYTPWIEAAKPIIPQASQAYGTGLGIAEALAKAYTSPEMMQTYNQSVPAYKIGFNIPKGK